MLLRNQIGSTTKFNRPESVFMEARTLLIPTTEYDVHALRVRLYKRYSTAVLIPVQYVRTPEELWNLCSRKKFEKQAKTAPNMVSLVTICSGLILALSLTTLHVAERDAAAAGDPRCRLDGNWTDGTNKTRIEIFQPPASNSFFPSLPC